MATTLSTSYKEVATSTNYNEVRVGLKYKYTSGKKVRVYLGLYASSSYSGGYGSDYSTGKINGSTVKSGSYRIYGVGWTDIGSIEITLSSGGTGGSSAKDISWSFNSFHFQGTPSGSVTIPAGAVPSSQYDAPSVIGGPSSFTAGTSGSLTITRKVSNSYTHDLAAYSSGKKRETIATKVAHGSRSWNPSLSVWGALMPNTLGPLDVTIYCTTYSGSTNIGQTSYTTKLSLPKTITPTVSYKTFTINNSFLNKYNLSGICSVKIECNVSTKYSSTLSTCITSLGSTEIGTSKSFTTAALKGSGSKTIKTVVTDSRGLSSSVSKSITLTDYSRPSLNQLVSVRCNQNGADDDGGIYLKPTFYPTFTDLVSGLVHDNEYTVTVKWRQKGTETWSEEVEVTSGEVVDTTFDGLYPEGLSPNKTYELQYSIQDSVGIAFSKSPMNYNDIISTSFALLDFAKYGESMGIGKISEADALGERNALEVGMPSYFYSGIHAKKATDVSFVDILDEMFYKKDDILTVTGFQCAGYVTSSGTGFRFFVPADKSMKRISSITFDTTKSSSIQLRQAGKYLHGTSDTQPVPSIGTISCSKVNEKAIKITFTVPTKDANTINNDVFGLYFSGSFKFT